MRENNDETVRAICKKISETAFECIWNGGKMSALTIWLGVKITLLVAGIVCKVIEQQKQLFKVDPNYVLTPPIAYLHFV